MRSVFFGTPEFAASVLEHIVKATDHEIVAVVSKPDRSIGRGRHLSCTPVKTVVQKVLPSVPIFQPEKASIPEVMEQLKEYEPDLFLVVAYGEILTAEMLSIPRCGSYNIHASLLPAYRGAAPIQWALIDGCVQTGISIFKLVPEMDKGDVVWERSCDITENMNVGELTEVLLEIAKKGIVETLELIKTGTLTLIPQTEHGGGKAPKIRGEDLLLRESDEIVDLHNRIRALSPKPGAFFLVAHQGEKKRLKVLSSTMHPAIVGKREWVSTPEGKLALKTPSGTLVVESLKLEGKGIISSDAFLRGVSLDDFRVLPS